MPGKHTYAVGYGKPPKSTRFKPGRSGNPKGRPSGRKNFKTVLEEELYATIDVTESGRRRKLTKQQVMVKQLCKKSMEGDVRATGLLTSLILKLVDMGVEVVDNAPLSDTDQAILQSYLGRIQTAAPAKQVPRPRDRQRPIRSKGNQK
jgi:hypothetical protein